MKRLNKTDSPIFDLLCILCFKGKLLNIYLFFFLFIYLFIYFILPENSYFNVHILRSWSHVCIIGTFCSIHWMLLFVFSRAWSNARAPDPRSGLSFIKSWIYKIKTKLTFTTLWDNSADDRINIFFLVFFFSQKQILAFHANCLEDNLHEMSISVFWEQ